MKYLISSLSMAVAIICSGCGDGDSIDSLDQQSQSEKTIAKVRPLYNPSEGKLSIPNDLLFTGTQDATLTIPVDSPDLTNPIAAINTLDGWASQQAFTFDFVLPRQISSLDATSAASPGSVRLLQVKMGTGRATEDNCNLVKAGLACDFIKELQYGEDFVTSLVAKNKVAVVPLKPLAEGQTYIAILTNTLTDELNRPLEPSETYLLVRQNISENPLSSQSQLALQAAVNSYEQQASVAGIDLSSVLQSSAITVQSIGRDLAVLKQLYAQQLAVAPTTKLISQTSTESNSVYEIFKSKGFIAETGMDCDAIAMSLAADDLPIETSLSLKSVASLCSVNVSEAIVGLPYYLDESTAAKPKAALDTPWRAACDSGVMLAQLSAEQISSLSLGTNDTLCQSVGLRDLGIDAERNITRYNPVPEQRSVQQVKMQVTTPNEAYLSSVGMSVTKPVSGWPVVMLNHGILSTKEAMLSLAATLSSQGFVTVAIDMALHGERGFDIDNDGQIDIVASDKTPSVYINLQNLAVLRDVTKQSVADLLSLRIAIAASSQQGIAGFSIDNSRVYFSGHSLGAMWGIDFVALANTPHSPQLDSLYHIDAASFSNPSGGIAGFLVESGSFGPFIQGNIILSAYQGFLLNLAQKQIVTTDQAALLLARSEYISEQKMTAEDILAFEAGEALFAYLSQQGIDVTQLTATQLKLHYSDFRDMFAQTNPAALAVADTLISEFVFAAQTMLESADPNNYASMLAQTTTPFIVTEIFGDGTPATWDSVIPPFSTHSPISGTEALQKLLQIDSIDSSVPGDVRGFIRFNQGGHSSLLSPESSPAVTLEMQQQIVSLFLSEGMGLSVNDSSVLTPAN